MTRRAARICSAPGCGAITQGSRCPAHEVTQSQRRGKDPEQAKFYNSTRWKKTRAIVRAQEPMCRLCEKNPSTNVDHIDGDFSNNVRENLRGLCDACNSSHTARQHRLKQGGVARGPFVVLCGAAGVGKTAIRRYLAVRLNAVSLGPDDFGGAHGSGTAGRSRWSELLDELDGSDTAVVECCTVPGALLRKVAQRGAFIVEVVIDEGLRRKRLTERGHGASVVEHLMREGRRLGYEQEVIPDLVVDASGDAGTVANEIAGAFICRLPRGHV